jgi:hypothetical protein
MGMLLYFTLLLIFKLFFLLDITCSWFHLWLYFKLLYFTLLFFSLLYFTWFLNYSSRYYLFSDYFTTFLYFTLIYSFFSILLVYYFTSDYITLLSFILHFRIYLIRPSVAFWILVKDVDGETILHHEMFILKVPFITMFL